MTAPHHPASWWRQEEEDVRCLLCPHGCRIPPGGRGICGVRRHEEGRGLVSMNYGLVSAAAVDPVEKKPLYHWMPGTSILSFGSIGCTMHCPFCQNWQIARCESDRSLTPAHPGTPLQIARKEGLSSVAFTYNEPLVWFEFLTESAQILRDEGVSVVLVSNGLINPGPRDELLPLLSAANIDLKAFTDEAYRFMGGYLEPVKKTIERFFEGGIHLEITFLLVPGINDSKEDFRRMTRWMASLSPELVLHISRYFPSHQWKEPATSLSLLREFAEAAREDLLYVYEGNTGGANGTKCASCGASLIERKDYRITGPFVDSSGRCLRCGTPSPFVI